MRKWRGRGLTCQVERWRGWKSGMRRELYAAGCGVFSCDGDERTRLVDPVSWTRRFRAALTAAAADRAARLKSNDGFVAAFIVRLTR